MEKLLRLEKVLEIIPISRSGFLAGLKDGKFPKPVKLGLRAVAWRERDIQLIVDNGYIRASPEKPDLSDNNK